MNNLKRFNAVTWCHVLALLALLILWPTTVHAQTANPCDSNASGPFVVTSAKSFTVQWCTAQTQTAQDGTTVPETIDGFYLILDNGPKQDIGKATSLGPSTVTNRDAWQYLYPSGVSKGSHTLQIQTWNYMRDPNTGAVTTTRQDGGVVSVPFSAVDPVYNLPPLAPSGGRIIR